MIYIFTKFGVNFLDGFTDGWTDYDGRPYHGNSSADTVAELKLFECRFLYKMPAQSDVLFTMANPPEQHILMAKVVNFNGSLHHPTKSPYSINPVIYLRASSTYSSREGLITGGTSI